MNKVARMLAIIGLTVAAVLGTGGAAQAHYDPWTTHSHYNSYGIYQMCSWWDATFRGCKHGYIVVW